MKEMQKTFEVSGPVKVDVQLPAGEVAVDASAEGSAEVELVAHDERSQQLVDDARVELRGNELVIDVSQRRRGLDFGGFFGGHGITCRVRVAAGSSLRARTKSADVHVRGPLAEADIATASGDVALDDLSGNLTVKTASGDVTARDVAGRAAVNTASGDILLSAVRGPVTTNTASGDIQVHAADDNVSANTASGDVMIGAASKGDVAVNSASGDVEIGVRRGSMVHLDCSSVSGDTTSELDPTGEGPYGSGPMLDLRARTVSGDIRIRRAPAPAEDKEEVHG
jgi:hypothetical protein